MPQSKKTERIIKLLGGDEPDYSMISTKLSEKDIPILNELIMHQSVYIAARAIICLTWFASDKSVPGIESAVKSDNPILRLTAAQAFSNIKAINNNPRVVNLINGLLDDKDIGVRKFALKTTGISKISSLKEKIQHLCINEQNAQIKELALQVFQQLEMADNPNIR